MRKFGLVGKELDHSWSADYFQQKFRTEKISDCIYENYSLPNLESLRKLLFREPSLYGLNITIPYKIEILAFLDDLDEIAAKIGAVNCIKIKRIDDKIFLKGFNTDSGAFRETLYPLLIPGDKKAIVLGTGGAAKAIYQALKELEIDYLPVSRKKMPGSVQYHDLDDKIFDDYSVIINATPSGMYPGIDDSPALPYHLLAARHLVYDLVYNPEQTILLSKAQQAGARIKNGLDMLIIQAEKSWEIWQDDEL